MPTARGPLPKQLGRYEILERLATGGMAEIFLATEHGVAGLERLVVVKRILPHLAIHESFVEMFLREARFAARLNHPNIVQIYELGQDAGAFFIAMEYIEGTSVRDLMAQADRAARPLPLAAALSIAIQASAGAHAAHELTDAQGRPLNLVHRDISPHNLMVTGAGHVKLLDFGVAKADVPAAEHTQTGELKGKLHYLSPEQCRHEPLDRRSDIFALGIVLWEMLSGRRLFKRESELETLQAIVESQVPALRDLRDDLPRSVERVVTTALARDRAHRYQSADSLRRALLGAAEAAGVNPSADALARVVNDLCGEAQARTRSAVQELVRRSTTITGSVDTTAVTDPAAERETVTVGAPEETPDAGGPHSGSAPTRLQRLRSPHAPAPRAHRRTWVVRGGVLVLSLALAAATAWWALREPAPVVSGPTIAIGFAPSLDRDLLRTELEPLRLYLERRTHRPLRFEVAASYRELGELLRAGGLQFALLPPNLYIETHRIAPLVEVCAIARYGGGQGSDGVLLVDEASTAQSVADLRHKRFCYTDPESTTGYLLPRAALRRAGVDPDRELAGAHFSGNHLQALKDLSNGLCDAIGTYSNAYLTAEQGGIAVAKLRVLAVTGRSPHEALCAAPTTDPVDRALVTQALITFDPQRDLGLRWVGKVQRISGFVPGGDADYDALRRALEATPEPAASGPASTAPATAAAPQPATAPAAAPSSR
ncbi:MAG: PhnD/SsuA/transferrin family substrate-binding protein [Deltaproteobacteria bacterium]|nr:PhnD/SsuA/transferrin family substrate-binding protein [Deltaproteobacteria bacterium]